MEDIALLINDLVGLNQQVIGIIVPLFVVYLVLFWLLVSVWVYFDARKRYENAIVAFVFALINFFPPFNFLVLIFYLVIRPEIRYDDFDDWEAGGVNVPIVNFMGKDGIELSFEMRIHPKKLRDSEKNQDMTVEIGWDRQDEKFKLIDRDELAKQVLGDEYNLEDKDGEAVTKNLFSSIAGRVKRHAVIFKDKISRPKKAEIIGEDDSESDEEDEEDKDEKDKSNKKDNVNEVKTEKDEKSSEEKKSENKEEKKD